MGNGNPVPPKTWKKIGIGQKIRVRSPKSNRGTVISGRVDEKTVGILWVPRVGV